MRCHISAIITLNTETRLQICSVSTHFNLITCNDLKSTGIKSLRFFFKGARARKTPRFAYKNVIAATPYLVLLHIQDDVNSWCDNSSARLNRAIHESRRTIPCIYVKVPSTDWKTTRENLFRVGSILRRPRVMNERWARPSVCMRVSLQPCMMSTQSTCALSGPSATSLDGCPCSLAGGAEFTGDCLHRYAPFLRSASQPNSHLV